jgi:hypothetical protein
MPGEGLRRLAVNEADGERLRLALARQLESDDRAAVLEAGFVVDVGLVPRRGSAHDLQHAAIEVGLLHVGHPVGRGTVPAVADGRGEVAILLTVEGVFKDQRP